MGENYNGLYDLNSTLKNMRTELSSHLQDTNVPLTTNQLKDLNNKFLTKTGQEYGNMLDKLHQNIDSNLDIQKNATKYSTDALNYLNSGNEILSDLNHEYSEEIGELKIEEDNKKRLIEMQRNRIYKYNFLKDTMLYIIKIILFVGFVLLIEKIFDKRNSSLGSTSIIITVSMFLIFLVFRYAEYSKRSKFNFRQYNVESGRDKYKKSVYEYNRDSIQGGISSGLDDAHSAYMFGKKNIGKGMKTLDHNVNKLHHDMKHRN